MRGCILFAIVLFSLITVGQSEVSTDLQVYKHWTVDFLAESNLLELSKLKDNEVAPRPFMKSDEVKQRIDAQRERTLVKSKTAYGTTKDDVKPIVQDSFNGKPIGNAGVPNDNTMAISNDGIIVSAINTTVTILNETGERIGFKSLYGITANQLGLLDRYYDPKVTYDPVNDRFILVFLEGSNSNDTRIIVGFTETADPTGVWSFYALDGKPLGGKTWSDYPIIAQNSTDLYITINILRDNESWQEGFVESLIWQINKQDGYDGNDDLRQTVFTGIEYGGAPVWSICPVQPGLDFDQDNMYFLSVRPDAESNDTVFLHEITNTSVSGSAEHRLTVLQSDKKYGVPPTAYQPLVEGSDFRLQTNDTRVLSAVEHNGNIHYTQSTILPDEIRSGIYHGIISNVADNPSVTAEIISDKNLDLAYPSIAFAGEDASDEHSMLLTFSHVGEEVFPGTSVVFHNKAEGRESLYSDIVSVKDGDSVINAFVADTAERWGDYTDIQRKYNEPGVVWACGSYGDKNGRNNVWIAKLHVENTLVTVGGFVSYPNPVESSIRVSTAFKDEEQVTIKLANSLGEVIKEVKFENVTASESSFLLNLDGMSSGIYILSVYNEDDKNIHSEKIIVK
ncbi:MAG: T9SS type A sorting domain-containing protein [Bacteroidia bacterium]